MYDYLIVGAGLFGAVFARQMQDAGKQCLVIDKRDHIAGNAYTEIVDGVVVHRYGAHILHTNDKVVWTYVNRFAEFNRFTNSPVANYQGELYNLPFNMNTFNKLWGVVTPGEAEAVIEKQRMRLEGEAKNLEEQALSFVGKDIYEKLIKGYTEKQWGRACRDLPAFIIRRLPVRFTYDNNYFSDCYQGIPVGGYTPLAERLLRDADVQLGTDYFDRDWSGVAKKTVYTGRLDDFYAHRFGAMEYRSLRFETESLDIANYQGCAVVNYTDGSIPYTRVIEHKHFEFGTQPGTVVTREYPISLEESVEPFYPVNDSRNEDLAEKYRALASGETDVIFGGRLADYRYYDMDKVIAMALAVAEREREA